MWKTLSIAALLGTGALSLFAQSDPVVDPTKVTVIHPGRNTLSALHTAAPATINSNIQTVTPALPLWQYTVVSPRDGNTYTGSMVGGNPLNRGARTTTLNVVLIPLRIMFTASGDQSARNFDPTSPDAGCLGAGNTALSLTRQSPLFNTTPNLTMNGVNVGTVTYPDGYVRANFWSSISAVSPAYHLGLNVTTASTQTLTLANNLDASGGTGSFAGHTYCSTNSLSADNPPVTGFVDVNYIDPQLNTIITNLGLTANQFPLFLLYGVVMTLGPPEPGFACCVLGYHSTVSYYPTTAAPGQTYGIAEYDAGGIFPGNSDISDITHEFMEFIDDPSTINYVPYWGNIGQVSGCQNNLEVGDPLTGTLAPGISMPNGTTYHPQELAFYSWFMGGTPTGAGGKYSSNGTLTSAAPVCTF